MPSRVFVSHSTKKGPKDRVELVAPAHRQLLDWLCEELGKKKKKGGKKLFQVDVDSKLRAGQHWREELFEKLGNCHAGIVLMNRKAIRESDWVHTEATILRWRQREDPAAFPLIFIFLGKDSRKEFDGSSKWDPLQFREVQFLDGGKEQTGAKLSAAAFNELVAALPQELPDTAYEAMRSQLETALRAALIGDQKRNAAKLARDLMLKGPDGLIDLLKGYRKHMDGAKGREVVEIIAPWWVDPQSAFPLVRAADGDEALRAFSVTAKDLEHTPEEYLRQAFREGPGNWHVVTSLTIRGGQQGGAAFRKEIVSQVEAGLIEAFPHVWDQLPPPRSEINSTLDERNEVGFPTFVALPNSVAGNTQLARDLWAAFPGVTLIHLTSTRAAAKAIKPSHVLEPFPDLASEESAHKACRIARGSLR